MTDCLLSRSLAGDLGVNVNTVRAAYAKLEADGLVATRQGIGSVVLATSTGGRRVAHRVRSNTIAVLIAASNPFYLPMLRGIEDAASERGALVLITDSRDSPTLADAMMRRLIARGVDGIIAVSVGSTPDPVPADGIARLPPIVYVDQPQRRGYSLVFDGSGAGYAATRHLNDHGHARIGLLTAPLTLPNVAEVHRGYLKALEDAGHAPSPELVSEVPEFSAEAGRAALSRLLELPDPPAAVFAAASNLALGRCTRRGYEGCTSRTIWPSSATPTRPCRRLLDPPLTMVEVPAREIGAKPCARSPT